MTSLVKECYLRSRWNKTSKQYRTQWHHNSKAKYLDFYVSECMQWMVIFFKIMILTLSAVFCKVVDETTTGGLFVVVVAVGWVPVIEILISNRTTRTFVTLKLPREHFCALAFSNQYILLWIKMKKMVFL